MSDDGPGAREVAYRPFAAEFDDASLSYSESDEERAPNYVVTPTGARINRLFAVGVLIEVERINDDTRRGRIVDPSGAFVTYAGQYQPEAQTFLERAETPSFVALTGKARTFEPEDSDRVFTSVRPESINEVDAGTRDRWIVSAAESTLDRLAVLRLAQQSALRGEELRAALEAGGAPASLAAGIPLALDHYDTSPAYVEAIRRLAVDALELVADERNEVRAPETAPGEGGDVAVGPLPETDVTVAEPVTEPGEPEEAVAEPGEPEEAVAEPGEPEEAVAEPGEPEGTAEPTTDSSSEPAESAEEAATSEATPTEDSSIAAESSLDASPGVEAGTDATEPAELDADLADAPTDTPDDSDASADGEDVLGDFDERPTAGGGPDSSGSSTDDSVGVSDADELDVGDEMYELDDDERDRIESEFGTEFSTGSEVDDPGEADIDVPEPDEVDADVRASADAAAADATDATTTSEATDEGGLGDFDADVSEEPAPDADDGADPSVDEEPVTGDGDADAGAGTSAADVDLETAAVEAMETLDDGDGADHDAVVDAVVSEHGVNANDVEDAIEDALMSGKCYEPGDGVLKAI